MEGRLSKWTNVVKGWQYRWFKLDKQTGVLSYYTSKEKMTRDIRRGCLKLKGAVVGVDDEYGNTFSIATDSKTFHLQAEDREDLDKWLCSLEDAMSSIVCDDNCPSTLQLDSLLLSSTVQDFDKKVEEVDAYIQVVIEQNNSLKDKMELEVDTEKKSKYESILNQSMDILEFMKHSVVLLQIAKNNTQLVNEKYKPLNVIKVPKNNMTISHQCSTSQVLDDGTETSVSSIDEDDDFYDAKDNHENKSQARFEESSVQKRNSLRGDSLVNQHSFTTQIFKNDNIDYFRSEKEQMLVDTIKSNNLSIITSCFRKPDGSLDYDALYESSDFNSINTENQGSIIAHLLSQVKIGMDLTKVVLPTFILETRSLLEMYADYFAHPDMFLKISELSSERERMVQVLRWYICSYHAARKSPLPKKPYNPVLGEIFQCYWEIPGTDNAEQLVMDGPVPWCNKNHLAFVAEQVSHHPPVSAFYAEHYNKQICFSGFVWTKSKFLGLSIGVHNIGHGVINVLKYDEQYVVTFPNGYGRSILTVPWIELGGTVTITCKKTGYKAVIEFLTKPFYGGKKHRISGEVFAANEEEPFLTITGEWNGMIEGKWCNGKTELFADVRNLPVIKKRVRPVEKQGDLESRKLWKEVTAGLKLNNIPQATNAKCSLEQKQRMEAQKRKELGVEWKTKLFKQAGDSWVYIKPLSERLSNIKHEGKEKY